MLFWWPPPGESNRFFVVDLFRGEEWGCCGVVCGGGCVEVDEDEIEWWRSAGKC
jgi:hypothetical protein